MRLLGVSIINLLVPTGLGSAYLGAVCSTLRLAGGGFRICKTAQSYLNMYPLRGGHDPVLTLHYCFLIGSLSPP